MRKMFGTARWSGRYKGNPAVILSSYCNSELWVYRNDEWELEIEKDCYLSMCKQVGLPWDCDPINDIPIEEENRE